MPRPPLSIRGVDPTTARGATLFELLAVVVILVTLAAAVIAVSGDAPDRAREEVTRQTLTACRDAIVGAPVVGLNKPSAASYLADMGAPPDVLADLLRVPEDAPKKKQDFDPITGLGWRGPYVRAPFATFELAPQLGIPDVYGTPGDPAIRDAWGGLVVLQIPNGVQSFPRSEDEPTDEERRHARLVSPGPDGVLQIPRTGPDAYYPPMAACGDDLVLYLHVPDLREPLP